METTMSKPSQPKRRATGEVSREHMETVAKDSARAAMMWPITPIARPSNTLNA